MQKSKTNSTIQNLLYIIKKLKKPFKSKAIRLKIHLRVHSKHNLRRYVYPKPIIIPRLFHLQSKYRKRRHFALSIANYVSCRNPGHSMTTRTISIRIETDLFHNQFHEHNIRTKFSTKL